MKLDLLNYQKISGKQLKAILKKIFKIMFKKYFSISLISISLIIFFISL